MDQWIQRNLVLEKIGKQKELQIHYLFASVIE